MEEYQQLEKICKRLTEVPFSQWKEEKERFYTEIEGLRFYLASRVIKETNFQDRVMLGEGENSEIANLRFDTDIRYVKLEVVDLSSSEKIESYEQRNDLLLSLYNTITEGIRKLKLEQQKQREEKEISEGREKLRKIIN